MIHLKAAIFICSLVLFKTANGRPTSDRFENAEENDASTVISSSDIEKKQSDVPLIRFKRVSDQRLAELETLYALSKINFITTTDRPVYVKINPMVIGRRRRSVSDSNDHVTRRIDRRSSKSTINEILIS
ncbi:hypothetical protein KPH14_004234 [Odynerus spinipes]|uniref:Uncharacterized protein n=1 Tax=Odynerus spinipes TaxID=1348599 RepID=A0AAD9RYB3_9HYME|nr:hypothetical protein KPH14_004234 [Odynerus spinipes]